MLVFRWSITGSVAGTILFAGVTDTGKVFRVVSQKVTEFGVRKIGEREETVSRIKQELDSKS